MHDPRNAEACKEDSADSFVHENITVQARDGELHLLASGDRNGQPIVFMHGITEFAQSFLPVMKLLPKTYYAVSIDLRGRGESFKPLDGYWLRDYTDDLLAVWNMFSGRLKPPILVGHSLSGRIAAAFVAAYPQLVEALVLIDPPISGPGRLPFPLPLTRFTGPKAALEEGDMDKFAAYYVHTKMDFALKAEELRACSLPAIEQSYVSLNREPFHAYYRMISKKTLLLAAELSPLITDYELLELQQMNALVETKRIPGIGHEICKEDPELFVDELLNFLSGIN